jgi:hypothetical protein
MSPEEVLLPLSSLYDDTDSRQAARRLLEAPSPEREIERLYPALLAHHILFPALVHLERAGGDLESLVIPAALFRSTPRLNSLLPPPDECFPGRIALAALRRRLETHAALVRRTLHDLLDLDGKEQLILLFGRAIEALCPEYARLPRFKHDVDVFAPDLQTGLHILNGAWQNLGFSLQTCRTCPADDSWITHLALFRVSEAGHVLRIDLLVGGRPIDPHNWSAACPYPQLATRARCVEWDGRRVHVPSPEDILLMLAEKTDHKLRTTFRDFGDARFVLGAWGHQLDWDYVTSEALERGLGSAICRLAREADRQEGRRLVPARVLGRLAPGPVERLLFPAQARGGRTPKLRAKLRPPFRFLRQMAARLTKPRAAVRLLLDQFRVHRYLDMAVESWTRLSPETLILENTRITDAGLARLRGSTQLRTLSLGGTGISDAGLKHLQGLARLQRLYLANTGITDAGLAHLKDLIGLEYLDLQYTAVTDAGLIHLQGLRQLRMLHLDGAGVTDVGLAHLKGLASLRCLHLQYTTVTDMGVAELQSALPRLAIER